MPEFTRPFLYPKQSEAIFCNARWGLIEASTKSGKTVGCIAWILEKAFSAKSGQHCWWIAPISDQAKIAFRRVKAGLTRGSFTTLESPTPCITLMNGVTIWFKSADNPDSLYGEDVIAAVIDEASRVKSDVWAAIRSTLTATRGPARIIGNVKGRKNWFYEFCRRIEDGDEPNGHYSRITVTDAIDAGIIEQTEIDDARRNLPENVFRELYMAEAADDAGNPFGSEHIKACMRNGLADGPIVAWGIDLAKHQDWFVCIGLNAKCEVSALERWRGVPWRVSIRRVWAMVGEDTPALVDSTGVGDPVLEELKYEHGNFIGFNFSNSSKQKLMEGLAVSIQSHEISFPIGPIKTELDHFEYEIKPTGRVVYGAAEGWADDCVCALALARQMWCETATGSNIMNFYANAAQAAKARDEAARSAPEVTRFPWQIESDAVVTLDNELTELYNETLAKNRASTEHLCAACHRPITGPSRVSDGMDFWHSDCTRGARAA